MNALAAPVSGAPSAPVRYVLTVAAGVDDPANPFNNSARAQSYTPSLEEEWVWGQANEGRA